MQGMTTHARRPVQESHPPGEMGWPRGNPKKARTSRRYLPRLQGRCRDNHASIPAIIGGGGNGYPDHRNIVCAFIQTD